jgi:hypothetical protein
MITSLIGSILFSVVLVLYILLALGLPYGEYAMGGMHKILPKKERIICIISVLIQTFAILILLQGGSVIWLGFSDKIVNLLCYFFCGLSLFQRFNESVIKKQKGKTIYDSFILCNCNLFLVNGFKLMIGKN